MRTARSQLSGLTECALTVIDADFRGNGDEQMKPLWIERGWMLLRVDLERYRLKSALRAAFPK
jgi:hypothetical protein